MVGPIVAEAGSDPALRRHCVAARREDLGDAGGPQSLFGRTHRGAKPGAACANHDHVICVVDDLVACAHAAPLNAILASANKARLAPPTARNRISPLNRKRLASSWT